MKLDNQPFFKLSSSKGYSKKQCSEAMQVMELWDDLLVVKCEGGCLELPHDHFEIIPPSDYSKFKTFHIAPYFENNIL